MAEENGDSGRWEEDGGATIVVYPMPKTDGGGAEVEPEYEEDDD